MDANLRCEKTLDALSMLVSDFTNMFVVGGGVKNENTSPQVKAPTRVNQRIVVVPTVDETKENLISRIKGFMGIDPNMRVEKLSNATVEELEAFYKQLTSTTVEDDPIPNLIDLD